MAAARSAYCESQKSSDEYGRDSKKKSNEFTYWEAYYDACAAHYAARAQTAALAAQLCQNVHAGRRAITEAKSTEDSELQGEGIYVATEDLVKLLANGAMRRKVTKRQEEAEERKRRQMEDDEERLKFKNASSKRKVAHCVAHVEVIDKLERELNDNFQRLAKSESFVMWPQVPLKLAD